MDQHLKTIRNLLQIDKIPPDYKTYKDGNQIYLISNWGRFARLKPTPQHERWEMNFFLNRDRWRRYEFIGTIEECLDLLSDTPHYLFWEG